MVCGMNYPPRHDIIKLYTALERAKMEDIYDLSEQERKFICESDGQ